LKSTAQRSRSGARHAEPKASRASLIVVVVLLLLLGGGALAAVSYWNYCKGASGERTSVEVTVPDGASGSQIVDVLHAEGVIRCSLVSKFRMRNIPNADSIRAGRHELKTNMTLEEAVEVLSTPPSRAVQVRLTIPPGFGMTQTAERVQAEFGIPTGQFLKEARSGEHALEPYLPQGKPAEGFLFPQTYKVVKKTATPASIIDLLLEQFREEAGSLDWDRAEDLSLTPYEVVIVASMIEEEAQVDRERRLIAGVIYNRLREGMQLGIDATLLYTDEDGDLTDEELEEDTPYNTRVNLGLPPTPISSPGLDSLGAALEPADTDFLYYVACEQDGEGRHRFARTLTEHNNNVNDCLG
jgi:UPF0755 protein